MPHNDTMAAIDTSFQSSVDGLLGVETELTTSSFDVNESQWSCEQQPLPARNRETSITTQHMNLIGSRLLESLKTNKASVTSQTSTCSRRSSQESSIRRGEKQDSERSSKSIADFPSAPAVYTSAPTMSLLAVKNVSQDATLRRRNEVAQFFKSVGEVTQDPEKLEHFNDTYDSDDGDSKEVRVGDDGSPLEGGEKASRDIRWIRAALSRKRTNGSRRPRLPSESRSANFAYKGISSNPPEITMRGISRGNYSQLHRKAWLEVADPQHRYGKNLRLYYRHWESLGHPANDFFQWLDSKGSAEGQPKPDLEVCPRSELDSDTVFYISDNEVTKGYTLNIECDKDGNGYVYDLDGQIVTTGEDGWIFVMRDNVLYGAPKITSVNGMSKQRFHHSTFFGGKAVSAAGILITDTEGRLTMVYPHSGHYRPGEAEMQQVLFFFENLGVDLNSFQVDMQQLVHINRKFNSKDAKCDATKKKKVCSLYLLSAYAVHSFLSHKAHCIDQGIFSQIVQFMGQELCVREALEIVDNGGYWKTFGKSQF